MLKILGAFTFSRRLIYFLLGYMQIHFNFFKWPMIPLIKHLRFLHLWNIFVCCHLGPYPNVKCSKSATKFSLSLHPAWVRFQAWEVGTFAIISESVFPSLSCGFLHHWQLAGHKLALTWQRNIMSENPIPSCHNNDVCSTQSDHCNWGAVLACLPGHI